MTTQVLIEYHIGELLNLSATVSLHIVRREVAYRLAESKMFARTQLSFWYVFANQIYWDLSCKILESNTNRSVSLEGLQILDRLWTAAEVCSGRPQWFRNLENSSEYTKLHFKYGRF